MTTRSTQTTVGELVKDRPARSRVFEQFKIDFCCGGKIPLAEACEKKGLDPDEVLDRIRRADAEADAQADDAVRVDGEVMGLAALEPNMHQHVHKENNVLFPKSLDRETQRNTKGGQ
jgi:regulator of cell morphogenesis and NO signaling